MPIQVKCKCGQAMVVPDSAAGKVGKCKNCQQPIRVPNSKSPGTAPTANSQKPTAVNAAPVPAAGGLDRLFEDAGLKTNRGPACPSCGVAIKPNTAICVECGFHFERGEKLAGYQVAGAHGDEFDNMHLNDAARNLARDNEAEERTKNPGSPWWVTLAMVLGIVVLIGAGIIRADATTTGDAAKGTLAYSIQKMPIVTLLPGVGSAVALLVYSLSAAAVAVAAFKESIGKGFLSLFVPFYSQYYAFTNRIAMDTTASVHLLWTVLLIVFLSWFAGNNGFKWL